MASNERIYLINVICHFLFITNMSHSIILIGGKYIRKINRLIVVTYAKGIGDDL